MNILTKSHFRQFTVILLSMGRLDGALTGTLETPLKAKNNRLRVYRHVQQNYPHLAFLVFRYRIYNI